MSPTTCPRCLGAGWHYRRRAHHHLPLVAVDCVRCDGTGAAP